MCVCYSDRGGSVLWSAGSAWAVCCLEAASPLSCVLFLRSAAAAIVPEALSFWAGGLTRGLSGDTDAAGAAPGDFSWGGGDTSSFSRVGGNVGAVPGLFFWEARGTGGFSRVWVRAGSRSRTEGALLRPSVGLKSLGGGASA